MIRARLTALLLGAQIVLGPVALGVHALAYHSSKVAPIAATARANNASIEQSDRALSIDTACPLIVHASSTSPTDRPPAKLAATISTSDWNALSSAPAFPSTAHLACSHARAPPLC